MRFRCIFTLYRLHHRRRSGFSFLHLDGQVTQHGIIEFEGGFQLDQGLVVAFDVQEDLVCFSQFLDRVSHLTTTPIFNTVYVTATARYGCFVTFDHGRHLLALVRMDDKYYFIVTHANSLKDCEYAHPGVKTGVGRGKPATIAAFMAKSQREACRPASPQGAGHRGGGGFRSFCLIRARTGQNGLIQSRTATSKSNSV